MVRNPDCVNPKSGKFRHDHLYIAIWQNGLFEVAVVSKRERVRSVPAAFRMPQAAPGMRHILGWGFLFSIFVNLLMLTGPLFMLQIYDRVLGSRSEETLAALLMLVVGLYVLMWLLDFARTRLLARFGARFQSAIDGHIFQAHLMHTNGATGTRLPNRDLETVQGFLTSPALPALMDVPFTPLFIAVIFVFHPWLGWFAVGGGLTLIALTALNQLLTSSRVADARHRTEIAYGFAGNAHQAAELVRSQAMLAPVVRRFVDMRTDALRHSMTAVDWTGAFTTFTKAFRLALQSLVLALGAWLVLRAEVTAGAMIAASILLGRALSPIEQIIARWSQIAQARDAHAFLKAFSAETTPPPKRTHLPRPGGRLDIKSVTVTTAPGRPPILYNVGFSVEPGEALGVVGRSGSGKTTLAKTVLGLVQPSLGEVRLDGALTHHYDVEALGQHIGYLPQEPVFLDGTIAENIARMSLTPDAESIIAAAKKAHAHELVLSLPDGYDTRIEDARIGLSGGQRQRIALARALFGEPVLLVLDEPNSALDQDGTEALNTAIRTLKADGRSVIVMTHRPVAVSECDRLMVLDKGQIKAIGPRDDIIRSMMRNASDIHRVLGERTVS